MKGSFCLSVLSRRVLGSSVPCCPAKTLVSEIEKYDMLGAERDGCLPGLTPKAPYILNCPRPCYKDTQKGITPVKLEANDH